MELTKGARLGPYEVEAPLGAGGMGEVYRARDTRLERSVAIKILPAEFQNNAQLKLRFEREAKIVSQLNHPNICTLYDVGDGYLVMEMLEGESLLDRIARGPMPLAEVLRYGTEIAEALDRAHRAGIVHRDLKPGNVMITKGGAKLLDFGLSKSSSSDITFGAADATQQKPLTTEGTILGTFQYMAPEQLEGTEADARTDIFALGCVLYEMLTGRRAFEGKTRTSLIAAIVSGEPQRMTELQPLTPPAFEHVVAKCLAKSPDDRWQSAKDIAEELRWTASAGSQAGIASAIILQRRMRRSWIIAVAVIGWLLAIAAGILGLNYARRYQNAGRMTRTEIVANLAWNRAAPLTISPDGLRIAAVVAGKAMNQLWLRDLSTGEARLLNGTEGGNYPFWSPDSKSLGFFSGGKLKTINLESGAVQIVCDAPYGRGGAWSTQGVIVFAPNIGVPLSKVSENGGAPAVVTKLAQNEGTHRNPTFLPDGRHFLFSAGDIRGNVLGSSLRVGSIDGNFDRKILDYASTAAFADGWLLTVKDHNLVAQQFDAEKLELRGKPTAIAQHVDWYDERYLGVFGVGSNTLVYHAAPHPKQQYLRFATPDAHPVAIGEPADYSLSVLSRDGRRIVANRYDSVTDKSDLWLIDVASGTSTRVTFDADGSMEDTVAFSPDGQRLLLYTRPQGNGTMWIQPVGGGTKEILFKTIDSILGADWSLDGKTVIFSPQRMLTGQDLEIIHLDGDRKPVPFLHSEASEFNAQFSPDGKWIAYQSDESGRGEVYVTNFPAGTAKWQVSQQGGNTPRWSADGRQLYFRTQGKIAVATVHAGESFSADTPKVLDAIGDAVEEFGVASDGSILVLREVDRDDTPVTVVFNWQKLLGAR